MKRFVIAVINFFIITLALVLSSCFGVQDRLEQTLQGGNKYVYLCKNSEIEYLIIDDENKIQFVYEISGEFSGVYYEGFPPKFKSNEVYVTNSSGYKFLGVGIEAQLKSYLKSKRKASKIVRTFCKR